MRIVNATNSTQSFYLATGQPITTKPISISPIFLGDETIVRSILQSGLSCEEIGIVVGSTDEYEICRKAIPAGINQVSKSGDVVNYVYTDENKAKARLLEGKELTTSISSPNAILDMQLKLDKKDEEVNKLKKKIKDLRVELDQAKAAVEPLEKANVELNNRIIESNSNVEEVNDINNSLREKIKEVNDQNKQLLEVKSNLEKLIIDKDREIAGLDKNIKLLKEEGKKCLDKNTEMADILNYLVKTYGLKKDESGTWIIPETKDK
jgi:methyl-accepting chemotaxis protein